MPVVSSIFLIISLTLAVVIGPQTRPWTWGPALLALAVATLAAIPVNWRRGKSQGDFGVLALGALTVIWFAVRSWVSPVAELGQADFLLAAAVTAAFVSVRAVSGHLKAERILVWGIALLLLANVVVIGKQLFDPTYTPVFRARAAEKMISGFFAHYNEAANYLIASSMLVAAAALFGRHAMVTRIFWCLIAAAGLAGVWYTRSRGGIFGAAVGCGFLFAMAMIVARRRDAKWFVPALIAVPLIGIGIGAFLLHGWTEAQEVRGATGELHRLMDNDSRLYFLGVALSCIGLHPVTGGGARSFSWECFRFVDGKSNGDIITHKPELVHNELVQAVTDYGLLGAGLLGGFLAACVVAVVLRSLFEEIPREQDHRDAWRAGALAAFAGMMVQSCFSFVFHLLPGILLLGICLGQISRAEARPPGARTLGVRILLVAAATASLVLFAPAAWKGTQVTRILWPTHFGKVAAISAESRMDALNEVIPLWPHSSFYQERAAIHQTLARENPGASDNLKRAVEDYQNAERLHPFDPSPVINRANVLSDLHRDEEAEEAYARGIQLQGGMEPAFRGHFAAATHYLRKSSRIFDPARPEIALEALELAAGQMETAVKEMHWITQDMREPRVAIHESLGYAMEQTEDRQGALQTYNFAVALPGGLHVHYRAGAMLGRQADEAWRNRRPAEALTLYLEARKRIGQAGNFLPAGVTPSQRVEDLAKLDEKIAFLKGAKVTPE